MRMFFVGTILAIVGTILILLITAMLASAAQACEIVVIVIDGRPTTCSICQDGSYIVCN